jgi:hypothetical protein
MNSATILWGVLFGSFGAGYFLYGKKRGMIMPLVCGIALSVFPYFVPNTILMVLIGAALIALPFFVRL